MKPLLLRLHRWTTFVFSIPLAVLILTGLVLSVEPIVMELGKKPGSLNSERLLALLDQHDKENKARGLVMRPYENRLILQGVGQGGNLGLDLTTGQAVDDSKATMLSDVFRFSRVVHEHFVLNLDWVVEASTYAMLVLIALGLLMGWPRIRHSLSGWHQGMAWIGLPLVVLSPLTGLAIAYGITFQQPLPRAEPVPMREAIRMIGREYDLSGLIWLRTRGGRMMVRLNEDGMFRTYGVSKSGIASSGTNWPRALHQGDFAGVWSGLMVLITSFILVGLMGTGLWIYFRRLFRKRQPRRIIGQDAAALS